MADAVTDKAGTPSAPAEPAPFFRPAPQHRDILVNPRRFGLAYLVLAIGVGVAVGLGIVLLGRSSHHATTSTATAFKPTQTGELGAKEIARHVSHKYRLANGQELVAVIGERPNVQNSPLFNYLVRPHDAQFPNDIRLIQVGNGIMYAMCGLGKNCATSGTETTDGTMLLKREALELSLQTFKSDSAVDTVTTLLPQGGIAIIFERSQLSDWIHRPLSSLLPEPGPLKPGRISSSEAQRIDLIEAPALYSYEAVQGPDGNAILRLDPIG